MMHTRMTSLTSFLRGCYLLSLLRPMLPSVGGLAISSDGYFCLSTALEDVFPTHLQYISLFKDIHRLPAANKDRCASLLFLFST